jgi:glycosyltransferase involved in cell wall biosynthesis
MKLTVLREGFNVAVNESVESDGQAGGPCAGGASVARGEIAAGGRIFTNNLGMHFFARLAPHFESVTILSGLSRVADPAALDAGTDWYPLDAPPNLRFVNILCCGSVAAFYRKLPLVYMRNAPVMRREFARCDAAVLSVSGGGNALMAHPILQRMGKPVFPYITSNLEKVVSEGFKYRGAKRKMAVWLSRLQGNYIRRMTARAAGVFYFGSELQHNYPTAEGRAHVTFASSINDGDIAAPRAGFHDPGRIRLAFVGRLAHEKGLHTLLAALEILVRQKGYDAELILCGEGRERGALEIAAERLGLAERVTFAGFVPPGESLYRILGTVDALVLPSISEGVPKVLLEAMARGLPVIASNVGGIPNIVEQDVNGILVAPGDAGELAAAVARLRGDDELYRRLSGAGVRFALDHTAEKQAARIAAVIKAAAGEMTAAGQSEAHA